METRKTGAGMDESLLRQIRIGGVTVGLDGLNGILAGVLARQGLREDEAAEALLCGVAARNYIPPGQEDEYRRALLAEYQRRRAGAPIKEAGPVTVRILGKDCVSCNRLQKMVFDIMAARGIVADVFQITDADEIGRYGAAGTPALIVNGRIRSAGILPASSQVEAWLLQAAEEKSRPGPD